MINIHDMGREVQLSFYSGPNEYEPSPGSQQCNTTWRLGIWPWNPIGAGIIINDYYSLLMIYRIEKLFGIISVASWGLINSISSVVEFYIHNYTENEELLRQHFFLSMHNIAC